MRPTPNVRTLTSVSLLSLEPSTFRREADYDVRRRLISLFLVGEDGRRPCFGGVEKMQTDPAWKDNVLFSEYFHGDNGAGLGASHQTGWTGIVADMIRRGGGADIPSLAELIAGTHTETES